VLIEKEAPGGQAGLSSRIENYLGFPMGLSGADLARNAMAQARRLGAEFITPREATALRTEGPFRSIEFAGGGSIATKAVVIATGLSWRRLSIPGLDPLIGAGVYYGAGTSEARACGNEDVYIIGGANSAGQAAMNFSKYARRVVMLVRGTALSATMSHYLIEQIAANSKIEVRLGTEVIAARGQERLEELTLRTRDGVTETVPATSLFIFIGAEPRTDWIENTVTRDPHGFVLTGEDLVRAGKRPAGWQLDRDPAMFETNVPGVYAVGDVRHGAVRRVASSVGEGSVVVFFAWQYLSKL
jgi:thioredoxin reductase (NADPH)